MTEEQRLAELYQKKQELKQAYARLKSHPLGRDVLKQTNFAARSRRQQEIQRKKKEEMRYRIKRFIKKNAHGFSKPTTESVSAQ